MAVLQIKMFNAPSLTERCEEVGEITKEVVQMCIDLLETFEHNERKALGLAANQLGYTKRIIVVIDVTTGKPMILLNPKISWYSKEDLITAKESCLSYPTLSKVIRRPQEIHLQAMDIEGKELFFKMTSIQARIVCHEIDHLNGCCKVSGKKR
jgi:peptide deformylase